MLVGLVVVVLVWLLVDLGGVVPVGWVLVFGCLGFDLVCGVFFIDLFFVVIGLGLFGLVVWGWMCWLRLLGLGLFELWFVFVCLPCLLFWVGGGFGLGFGFWLVDWLGLDGLWFGFELLVGMMLWVLVIVWFVDASFIRMV